MKRSCGGLLFFCVLLSMVLCSSALAADGAAQPAADALHSLGLFAGTGSGADGAIRYDLDRAPTRAESVTMLVRLLGKESEALSETWDTPFSDVPEWAEPYVGYAYAHGLTNGVGGDGRGGQLFDGAARTGAAQYLTFVLRALGYSSDGDFAWDRAWELTDKLGVTGGQYPGAGFTRGDAAVVSFAALGAKLKDSDATLADRLAADGVFSGEQYEAAKRIAAAEPPAPVSVRSVSELAEAIRPGAEIVIAPGRYDLTDFLGDYSGEKEREAWNAAHPYVRIVPVYDGAELEVRDVTGLSIRGGAEETGGVTIVTEPRCASVLRFLNCSEVALEGLTMGHTETGACSGNVLDFLGCGRVSLRAMDLYGCGVYGVRAAEGSSRLSVSDSVIRDCSEGPFELVDADGGEFRFTDCAFTGSAGGGYCGFWGATALVFERCAFGAAETYRWRWDETAVFEDCVWTED